MKITKSFLFIIGLNGLFNGDLRAQQGQHAAGGDLTGSGGNLSYTMGQAFYISLWGSGGAITEGVQQPFEILVITGIEETGIQLSCTVYPNPTASYILLTVEESTTDRLTYQVFNTSGKLLMNEKVAGIQTTILLNHLSDAVYFIKVLNGNQELKTFKIIKNS